MKRIADVLNESLLVESEFSQLMQKGSGKIEIQTDDSKWGFKKDSGELKITETKSNKSFIIKKVDVPRGKEGDWVSMFCGGGIIQIYVTKDQLDRLKSYSK